LTLDELNEELDGYSERVSTQLRTINLGVLGIVWLLLLKQHDVERIATQISERGLLCLALACIIVLGLDILQYKFAERAVDDAFNRAEQSPSKKAAYYEDSFDYQAQIWCYRLKLLLTAGNALGLLVLVGYALI